MSLVSAEYFIFSGPRRVGRHPIEDRSLLPKRVLALPPGVKPLGPWQLEHMSSDRYKLLALGVPVAEDKGLLFAFLLSEPKDFEWVVTPKGDDNFTIETPNRDAGWSAGEDGSQITVTPFFPGPGDGSERLFKFYPATEI